MSENDKPSAVTINENIPKSDSNSATRAVAGIIGLLLVVAGVYAMVEPMSQRIDFLEREVQRSRTELNSHEAVTGHTGLIQQKAVAKVRFKEIETQFKSLRDIVNIKDDISAKEISLLESRLRELALEVAKIGQCIKMLHKEN